MKKKATTKEPFLPFFVGDFLGATAEWDGEERALYMMLLSFQWTLGSLPNDARKLRKLVDYQESNFDRWWPTVSTKFEVRTGRLLNARLEVHRAKTKELSGKNSASGRKGAAARWIGSSDNMASANGRDGERHADGVANANEGDGERHQSAIPQRHPKSDGALDGNPSYPIPSDPNPSDPIPSGDRSSQSSSVVGAEKRAPTTTAGEMAGALLKANIRVTSINPTLLKWIEDRFTTQQVLEAVQVARMTKGDNENIGANYLDKILRDPGRRQQGTMAAPAAIETAAQREFRMLHDEGAREGFRAPREGEHPDQYRRELKAFARQETAKAMERLQAAAK